MSTSTPLRAPHVTLLLHVALPADNEIGPEGAAALAEALRGNTTVVTVCVSGMCAHSYSA